MSTVSKEAKDYNNTLCRCGHTRSSHVSDGGCRKKNCKCYYFDSMKINGKEVVTK